MSDAVEMLDLVDENDVVQGTYPRDEIYANNMQYVRVVEAFIQNSEGKLWIPVRLDTKRIAPGGYDVGIGGHIEHGETALDALRKEVSEEAGWDIDNLTIEDRGKFGPKEGLNTISYVYIVKSDEAPVIGLDDFKSAEWLTPQEIADNIRGGHPAKLNLLPLLQNMFEVE